MDRHRKLEIVRLLVQDEVERTRLSAFKYLTFTVGLITSTIIAAVSHTLFMLVPLAISVTPAIFLTLYQYNNYSLTKRILKKIDSELKTITAEWRLLP